MKEIARKYNIGFSLYSIDKPDIGSLICVAIYKPLNPPNILVFRIDEDLIQELENQREWLFSVKMKKNELNDFLNEIKDYVRNRKIPEEKVFYSSDSIVDCDLMLMDFEHRILLYLGDYKINKIRLNFESHFLEMDRQLAELKACLDKHK